MARDLQEKQPPRLASLQQGPCQRRTAQEKLAADQGNQNDHWDHWFWEDLCQKNTRNLASPQGPQQTTPKGSCSLAMGCSAGVLLSRQGHGSGLTALPSTAPAQAQICSCSTECGQVKGNSCINTERGIQLALAVLFLVWNDCKAIMNLLVTRIFKDMETRGGGKQGTGDTDSRLGLKQPIKVVRESKGNRQHRIWGWCFLNMLLKYSG